MDALQPTPVPQAAPDPAHIAMQEEKVWRDKEEKIKEMTFDVEMKEKDQSVRTEESELIALRDYPLDSLVAADVIAMPKRDELAANGITTVFQLLEWVKQQA
jgi:hypothetical protein